MKYNESNGKNKFVGSATFYILIACCLIAIGGASFLAMSSYKKKEEPQNNSNSSEYKDNSSSYNSNKAPTEVTPSSSVEKTVSDEPKESTQTEKKEEKVIADAFMMPVEGDIIKGFSENELQYSATYKDMRLHKGTDIAAEAGSNVNACGNGKVVSVEDSPLFGTVVTIDHGNSIVIKYASIKDCKLESGQTVQIGDVIGTVGEIPSECGDQSHIHIEVFVNDKPISPLKALGIEK